MAAQCGGGLRRAPRLTEKTLKSPTAPRRHRRRRRRCRRRRRLETHRREGQARRLSGRSRHPAALVIVAAAVDARLRRRAGALVPSEGAILAHGLGSLGARARLPSKLTTSMNSTNSISPSSSSAVASIISTSSASVASRPARSRNARSSASEIAPDESASIASKICCRRK